jgi:hypothetical protein
MKIFLKYFKILRIFIQIIFIILLFHNIFKNTSLSPIVCANLGSFCANLKGQFNFTPFQGRTSSTLFVVHVSLDALIEMDNVMGVLHSLQRIRQLDPTSSLSG